MERYDLLLVINQEAPLPVLANWIKKYQARRVMVLSSHALFSTERSQIAADLPDVEMDFVFFGQFQDDNGMMLADQRAAALAHSRSRHPDEYVREVMSAIVEVHNAWYAEYFDKQGYEFVRILIWAAPPHKHALGIDVNTWQTKGGRLIIPWRYHTKARLINWLKGQPWMAVFFACFELRHTLRLSETLYLLRHEGKLFVFFSLRRLKFVAGCTPEKLTIRRWRYWRVGLKNNSRARVLERILSKLAKPQEEIILATPLHEYFQTRHKIGWPLHRLFIFEDAFRPSNYPRYYYADAFPVGEVVVRDMFDARFFSNADKVVHAPPDFIPPNYLNQENRPLVQQVHTVILSLNYAGDWTNLINRGDTDLLIEALADLAVGWPGIQFVVRLHPGMEAPWGEGRWSKARVNRFIDQRGLPNLSVSRLTIEEDWERGNLFLSEYSLSVLDAIKLGKLGLFINPTNRRSFVQDYLDLGFAGVNGLNDLPGKFAEILAHPSTFANQQQIAMQRYNDMLRAFMCKPKES